MESRSLNEPKKTPTRRTLGFEIEGLVADYLQKQKILLLHRNFQCRLGEIDLIGLHNQCLIFVEVRYRSNPNSPFGTAAESVTYTKQQKLKRTALFFLRGHSKWKDHACRFDVIAVTLNQSVPVIDWIQNAFY